MSLTHSWDRYAQHSKVTMKKRTNVFTVLSLLAGHCENSFFLLDLSAYTSGLQNSSLMGSYKILSLLRYS